MTGARSLIYSWLRKPFTFLRSRLPTLSIIAVLCVILQAKYRAERRCNHVSGDLGLAGGVRVLVLYQTPLSACTERLRAYRIHKKARTRRASLSSVYSECFMTSSSTRKTNSSKPAKSAAPIVFPIKSRALISALAWLLSASMLCKQRRMRHQNPSRIRASELRRIAQACSANARALASCARPDQC